MAVSISVDEPDIDIAVRTYEGYTEATGIRAPVVMGSAASQKGDSSVAGGLSAAVVMGDVTSTKGDASVAGGISAHAVQGDAQSHKGDQSVAGGVSSQVVAGDAESDKGDASVTDGQSLPVVMGAVQMEGPIDLVQEYLFASTGRDAVGAHYEVDGDSSLYQDSGATTPATADGDPVGYVEDLTGQGNHATQSTTANKPVLRQGTNGKKYLEFQQGERLNTGVSGDTVVLGYALPSIGGADLDYAPSSGLALEVTGAEYAVVSGDIPSVEKDALSDYMQGVATAYASGEVTTLRNHFREQPLQRAGVDRWDTSKVTSMFAMFFLTSVSDLSPISSWDTSQVTDMSAMFDRTSVSDLSPISSWDTSQVTDMGFMFNSISVSDLSPLSDWDISQVTNMSAMFAGTSVSDLSPLSDWDTSQVTNMRKVFRDTPLSDLSPLSDWDTSQVTRMRRMFFLTSVSDLSPISGWDVSALSNAEDFARGAPTDSVSAGDMLAGWTDGSPNTASDLQSGVTIGIPNADYTQMNTAGQDAVDALQADPPNWEVNIAVSPLLENLQVFADYENWSGGDPLPNRYTQNSGITSLTDNNTVQEASNGNNTGTVLVGSESGFYATASSEAHTTSTVSPFAISGPKDVYVSFWADLGNISEFQVYFSTRTPGDDGYEIFVVGSKIKFGSSANDNNSVGVPITTGVHFCEVWLDGSALDVMFRIDDGSITTKNLPRSPADPTAGAAIAKRSSSIGSEADINPDNLAVEIADPNAGESLQWPRESTWLYNGGNGRSWSEIQNRN